MKDEGKGIYEGVKNPHKGIFDSSTESSDLSINTESPQKNISASPVSRFNRNQKRTAGIFDSSTESIEEADPSKPKLSDFAKDSAPDSIPSSPDAISSDTSWYDPSSLESSHRGSRNHKYSTRKGRSGDVRGE